MVIGDLGDALDVTRHQLKQIRRVELLSLIVVEILTEWTISIGLVKDMFLMALVAVSLAYASCFVAYEIVQISVRHSTYPLYEQNRQ